MKKGAAMLALLAAVLAVGAYLAGPYLLRTGVDEPPQNFAAFSERLATAGQPSPAQLDRLAEAGYALVVNLAPPDSYGTVADEAARVTRQGIAYLGLPVDWHAPGPADFALFSSTLRAAQDGKVLVHCQRNYRAASFAFLYQVVHQGVSPDAAAETLRQVWIPNPVWSRFIEETLARHGIANPL